MSIIKLDKVSKYYSKDGMINVGLNKVSLEFSIGEFVAITGTSGSGKSTLSNVISGIDTYEDGEMYLDGKPTSHMSIEEMEHYASNYISFIFQNYNIIDNYTVFQNIKLALILAGYERSEITNRCNELIQKVGLENWANQKASKLSGGQQQRVVIARALATGSDILIADEPTGNLDDENSKNIIKLLHEISKDKLVLVVSHDYDELADFVTRKIRLMDGRVVEDINVREKNKVQDDFKESKKTPVNLLEILQISLLNILTIPKITIFKLTLFMFFMFGISIAYGNFINVSYSGYINAQEGFEHGDMSPGRLIVTKQDLSYFTDDEVIQLQEVDKVQSVITKGMLLNLDKVVVYPTVDGQPEYYKYRELEVASIYMIDESDLVEGRMPQSEDEVVITYDSALFASIDLEGKNRIRITDEVISLTGDNIHTLEDDLKVVGIVNRLAINDKTIRVYFTNEYMANVESDLNLKNDELYLKHEFFTGHIANISQSQNIKFNLFNDTDDDVKIQISYNLVEEFCSTYRNRSELEVYVDGKSNGEIDPDKCITKLKEEVGYLQRITASKTYEDIEITFTKINKDYDNEISMGINDYLAIFGSERITSLNIIVKDYRDALEVQQFIKSQGYAVVYPFNELDKTEFIEQRNLVLFIFIGVTVLLSAVSWIVLSLIQKTKEKRFIIKRSMGATKKHIKQISLLELSIVALLSFLVVASIIVTSKFTTITFLTKTYEYFGLLEVVVILMLVLINILLINTKIGKAIFSESINMSLRKM